MPLPLVDRFGKRPENSEPANRVERLAYGTNMDLSYKKQMFKESKGSGNTMFLLDSVTKLGRKYYQVILVPH